MPVSSLLSPRERKMIEAADFDPELFCPHNTDVPGDTEYFELFRYFVEGWNQYKSPMRALARYPGWRSWSGEEIDAMEGFARMMPLFAAWVRGGRERRIQMTTGAEVDLVESFRDGLLAGTNPASSEYWGSIGNHDQRIVEAADIALALWLLREEIWNDLRESDRSHVVKWLTQIDHVETPDNNWHLFAVQVSCILKALGRPIPSSTARKRYERVKRFYRGDGWFGDGQHGSVDYYNAWGFHYALFWIGEVDPTWDRSFLEEIRAAFLSTYRFLIGPEGFPMIGRSACYRLAAPAPLVFGHISCPDFVSAGQARRALDTTWSYFIAHGALRRGTITQGYFGDDPRLLENYSGPASCFWSLRSLIPAFYQSPDAPFWKSAPEPLPVELADYEVHVPPTGWTIRGSRSSRVITIETPEPLPDSRTRLRSYGPIARLLSFFYPSPQRPGNYEAKYRRKYYSSANPMCEE